MILYLVRHGQSVANTAGMVTGTQEDKLSEIGVQQARELKEWLKSSGITANHYVTSSWRRAQQTANIIYPDVKWTIDARVGETNAGEVANWESKKFISAFPTFHDGTYNRYPAGESHDELNTRAVEWLLETASSVPPNEKVVLVGHAGPISCILQYAAGVSMDRFPAFLPPNASLSVVEIQPSSNEALPRILAFSLCPQDAISRSYIFNGVKWP